MRTVLNSQQMKAADRYTIDVEGVPSEELMLRAASHVADAVCSRFSVGSAVLVVCGSGNNGGDGFAAASILKRSGYKVDAVMLGNRVHCTEECAHMLQRAEEDGICIMNEIPDNSYDVLMDAIFGIGLTRVVEGRYAQAIDTMNVMGGFKLAVDIASGIDANTGGILGTAFRADLTVAFAAAKYGHMLYPGKTYTGELIVCDIGIYGDPKLSGTYGQAYDRISAGHMLPERRLVSNKGTYGKLLVIAGSSGMSGAAFLSALAGYRCGAGLVRILTDESNRIPLQTLLPEAILTTYSSQTEAIEKLAVNMSRVDAIVCGPGLGMLPAARSITEYVLENRTVPVVLDADALNCIAKHGLHISSERSPLILTPHLKEMSRLSGIDISALKTDLIKHAAAYAQSKQVILILKDAVTITADPQGGICVNTSGCPAMAKGGSGDVLTGVIGAYLCQKLQPEKAASLGVYVHGLAGELLQTEWGPYAGLARELADNTGRVMGKLKLDE